MIILKRPLPRRLFLQYAGIVVAGGLVPAGCDRQVAHDLKSVAGQFSRFLRQRHVAHVLGQEFLKHEQLLETPSVETVTQRLLDILEVDLHEGDSLSVSSLKSTLAQHIRDDFASEQVAVVKGWLLSTTELYLCAISYLDAT